MVAFATILAVDYSIEVEDEPVAELSPSPAARAERVVFVALGVFLVTALAGVGFFAIGAQSFGSAIYAKVYACPGPLLRSLRVAVVQVDSRGAAPVGPSVTVVVGGARVDATLDAAGFAEITLDAPSPLPTEVSVEHEGVALVRGTIPSEATKREWRVSPVVPSVENDVGASLMIERGALVASLPGRVRLIVRRPPLGGLTVTGAGVTPTSRDAVVAGEATMFDIVPRDGIVDLEFNFGRGEAARASFRVPARLAGMVVERQGDEVHVISPSPRSSAFLSLHRGGLRVGGARVDLAENPAGFFGGLARLPGAGDADAVVVVSSDADEGSAGTLAWPLGDPFGEAGGPLLAKILDGRASVEAARARVLARYKLGAGIAVAISILGMAFSIVVLARRAHEEGSAQLDGPSSASSSRRVLFGTAALVIAVLLLLGMTVLWVAFHLFGA